MDPVQGTKELVRIPSISRERSDIAEFIANQVDGTIQEFPVKNASLGRNVFAVSEPYPGEPFLLLNGHHDTVAIAEGWTHDPFDPEELDGRLFGLGTSDMKAGTAINISLFQNFRDRLNLIFTSSDDEESDSLGSFALISQDTGPLKPYLDRIHGVVITEPSNERIMLGARGRYALHLTVHGRSAHGARPHLGVNAVDQAAAIALRLSKLPMDSHPQLGTGSVCTLSISGGTRTLSVPDHCELFVDRHYTEPMTGPEVVREFRQGIGKLEAEVEIDLVDREVPFLEPYACAAEEPFIREFVDSIGSQTELEPGRQPEMEVGIGSGRTGDIQNDPFLYGASVGDYNIFGNILPTIVYGTVGRNHHSADEYVEIGSIRRVHSQLSNWLETLCKKTV